MACKFFIRTLMELFKILPLVVFPFLAVHYLKDYSQLQMAIYYMAVLTLSMGVFQVVRKFMFPTFSVEAHMKAALHEKNMASAVVVAALFAFVVALCYFQTWFMMASIPGIKG